MLVRLPYGKDKLEIELPETHPVLCVEPVFTPPLPDPRGALREALQHPLGASALRDFVRSSDRVGIIFNDITRPTPNREIIHAILRELPDLPAEQITLFNALGTHRLNTVDELRRMLDDELVDGCRIVQNNAFDPGTQLYLGKTARGHEIWLNRDLWACDVKILTGFIEPHFFAGYSGGGKAIMPGMAGLATIQANHGASMIGDPGAAWGITRGNPIWEEVREIALSVPRTFLVNVTLNKDKALTGIFCGDLDEAHARGCAYVKSTALVPVTAPCDIVITTNSGYPLDLNLYQSVKGMSAAAQVVKPGGAIIIATACQDGVPEHGLYGQLLKEHRAPAELLAHILESGPARQDQWQAQIQALIQAKADVYVYSGGLSDEQIRAAMLIPCRSIEATLVALLEKYGPQARLCVLTEGPQTIPYLTQAHEGASQ